MLPYEKINFKNNYSNHAVVFCIECSYTQQLQEKCR